MCFLPVVALLLLSPRAQEPKVLFTSDFPLLPASPQEPPERGFWERMRDPTDGQFDLTEHFSKGGFIPVPLVITEPAVGFGGGLALGFIHGGVEDPWAERPADAHQSPPSMSGLFGVGTSNGTWAAGGLHYGVWREDTIRYTGALATGQVILDFFVGDSAFGYALDADLLYQDIRFRLGDSDLFLGGSYRFLGVDAAFDLGDPSQTAFGDSQQNEAGLGGVLYWDSRNNIFAATEGQEALLEVVGWGDAVGGDSEFGSGKLRVKSFHTFAEEYILGARVSGEVAGGDVPFYALPFVQLRGVPAARYQGELAASLETQLMWQFDRRWSVLGFFGTGASWDDSLPDSDALFTGGVGARYLTSRPLGLQLGVDVAVGPESTAVYLAVGSGI